MPPLTIDGKRAIIAKALATLGEKAFVQWLNQYDISSLRSLNENVRRYKTKFFKALFEITSH